MNDLDREIIEDCGPVAEEESIAEVASYIPGNGRVFVRRDQPTQEGSIVRVKTLKTTSGRVIAVGSGLITAKGVRLPPELAVGDHVVFPEMTGEEVCIGGVDILILRETDIYMVIDNEPAE